MLIYIYDYITAAGVALPSLAREGKAMLDAVAADFAALPDVEVVTSDTAHHRTPGDEPTEFRRMAAAADWTLVIAPEIDRVLHERCRIVLQAGGRLLGPGLPLIHIASDKHLAAEHLKRHGVPTPPGRMIPPSQPLPTDFPYPAVVKPCDGAGSLDVRLVRQADDLAPSSRHVARRIEQYLPGLPVSVAAICGPAGTVTLPACRQRLSDDGRFAYLGGSLPLPPPLAERAERLARAAIETLPDPRGYLAFDLILGDDPVGDAVIEINPRLTTSYIGLRSALPVNLAAAMLAAAQGEPVAWPGRPRAVQFTPGEPQMSTDEHG